jgi:hypothetical protein
MQMTYEWAMNELDRRAKAGIIAHDEPEVSSTLRQAIDEKCSMVEKWISEQRKLRSTNSAYEGAMNGFKAGLATN